MARSRTSFLKIIEALEALGEDGRTPELASELARAYNNEADPNTSEGRLMLHRAIELLEPHEEALGATYLWNFRLGYAYYYLDQEGRALSRFRRAHEAKPEDKDAKEFMEDCLKRDVAVLPGSLQGAHAEGLDGLRRRGGGDPRHDGC
ncbi:MAG: hypothetical protein ACLUNV_04130 [Sutterella wadsworthensis]